MSNPAYPVLPIAVTSRRKLRDGRADDQGGDGVMRVRKMFSDKYDFDIVHPNLSTADQTTLTTFYGTYGTALVIDFTWPGNGVVYTVRFGAGALNEIFDSNSGLHAAYTVRLVGV